VNVCRVQKRANESICQRSLRGPSSKPTEQQEDLPDFISLKKHHAPAGRQTDFASGYVQGKRLGKEITLYSVNGRQAAIDAATAAKQSAETKVSTLLPADKASAEAELAQAKVEYEKTFIRARVAGRVEQFLFRPGDVVNPLMRPAGVLIPEGSGQRALQAGFGQIEAQVLKPGMVAEATCV